MELMNSVLTGFPIVLGGCGLSPVGWGSCGSGCGLSFWDMLIYLLCSFTHLAVFKICDLELVNFEV